MAPRESGDQFLRVPGHSRLGQLHDSQTVPLGLCEPDIHGRGMIVLVVTHFVAGLQVETRGDQREPRARAGGETRSPGICAEKLCRT